MRDGIAERDRPLLVLADRFQDHAEGRIDEAPGDQNADQKHGENEIIHVEGVIEIEDAEEVAARHRLDAVLALRELRLQAEEIEHVGQRQRDHGEIDALTADSHEAHDQAEQRCAGNADQDAELGRNAPFLHCVCGEIGSAAEERGMAEREQAGIAEQQIEGKQREAEHLHHEDRVDEERRPDQADKADDQQQLLHGKLRTLLGTQAD